ncbi:ferrous iron transporter B, partial [bacterium]|nr:ferrous iron transporter B [bacterium]
LLFFFISLLESSGYMTRAAYLMDGVMSKVGLSGKSFLPLLSGYACAIPGVMATRSIPSAKERLATILILPWTSCTARLPVYILLMPLLMPGAGSQALLLFGIYALGTLTALLAAKILRPRLGPIEPAQFMLELPPYQKPQWGFILRQVFERAFSFLKKAGTIILGISILLWFLETYPKSDSDDPAVQREASFMGMAGQVIEPVVEPLGWDARTGTAMLTSFAAREVFVSSLAISYSVDEEEEGAEDRLRDKLANAKRADGSPLFTPLTALSLLIFFIYALQCLPTTAVVRRETNSWKWALGQLGGMTLFAYLAALAVFQIGSLF